jgi:outer membrane receptor protein involved in Fe transport
VAILCAGSVLQAQSNQVFELEPVFVHGDLLQGTLDQLPASVSVMDTSMASSTGMEHFEDLLGRLPNLNWAGGTSRPRFFQIRGIGEISQFGNEVPASSVGFIIDGIDMTGIGGVAGLFDVEQVEVLRGPQAAAFGANALAGMVLVETASPTSTTQGKAEFSFGDNDLLSFGAAVGGAIGSMGDGALSYRISLSAYQDNGYRDNRFLNRDDTNERAEQTARLKLHWAATPVLEFDLTLLYFDFENGYDAWSLDNDSFITTTDEPGQDNQETKAAGLKTTWHASGQFDVTYQVSVTDSDILYSYDWDWSNPAELMEIYGPVVYYGTDVTERVRSVWSHDLRISSLPGVPESSLLKGWAFGIYHRDFEEDQAYFGVHSLYTTGTVAAYGQTRMILGDAMSMTLAARIEEVTIDYTDDFGTRLGSSDQPWGGKIALEYKLPGASLLYASIDRGFKAGGVNLDSEVPEDFRIYGTETLLNYELGWRGFLMERTLRTRITAFYMDREDIQVDSSIQLGDGNTFALYKDNAASGNNFGAEFELDYRVNESLQVFASLGLLETEFDDYSYIDPVDGQTKIILDGRRQAYAPGYNYAIGADYTWDNGFFAGATIEGKDGYVFDVANDQSLSSYNLMHLRAGFSKAAWRLTIWVNHVFDELHEVHGFYFANEPPNYYSPRRWVSHGTPRQIGATLRMTF